MLYAVGVVELKSIAEGIKACDGALKAANIRLVSAHPSCPGKYEIVLTGSISNVTASVEYIRESFSKYIIDSSVMGRIDENVVKALFGTQQEAGKGALGVIETFSAASANKAADLAVKTANVALYDLRISRGLGGKGIVLLTGDVSDVTAAVEAGGNYAKDLGLLHSSSVIAAPHAELWKQL